MDARIVLGGVVAVGLTGSILLAQTHESAPAFEVASIRAAEFPSPDRMRPGQTPGRLNVGLKVDGNRVEISLVTLADLLPYAYRVKAFQVSSPSWMKQSRWSISAIMPAGASRDRLPDMIQALLVERFKLTVRHEKRDLPTYELVVGKGGPSLEPPVPENHDDRADASPDGRGPRGGFPGFPGGPMGGGLADSQANGGNGAGAVRMVPSENCGMQLEWRQTTVGAFADALSPFLDRPVVDRTGLAGTYKIALSLPMETMMSMMQNMMRGSGMPGPGFGGRGDGPPGGGPPGGRGGNPPPGRGPAAGCQGPSPTDADGLDSSSAPIFQAVQKLGLKLQPRKASAEIIVVDHIERTPTEN